jgi:hypothetical protein
MILRQRIGQKVERSRKRSVDFIPIVFNQVSMYCVNEVPIMQIALRSGLKGAHLIIKNKAIYTQEYYLTGVK